MEAPTETRVWKTNYQVIPTTIDNNSFLVNCFACWSCNECLRGMEAVVQGGQTYCWKCYREIFALKCTSCLKAISGRSNMEFVCYNNQVWHRDCFRCSLCRLSLEGRNLVQERRRLYCVPCKEKPILFIG